jgi:hypothetical protein
MILALSICPFFKPQQTIENLIIQLPVDLQAKIYKEYLLPEILYKLYLEKIKTLNSVYLHTNDLLPILPLLLGNDLAIDYLLTKCEGFRYSYREHKLLIHKVFKKLNNGESFALAVLWYLYH